MDIGILFSTQSVVFFGLFFGLFLGEIDILQVRVSLIVSGDYGSIISICFYFIL